MKILGVSRSPRFSPNSTDRDAAIFAAVASRMQRGGNEVFAISEDLFVAVDLSDFEMVFSMAREPGVLHSLAEAEEKDGLRVVNSARALLAATRGNLVGMLDRAGIAQPPTQVLRLDAGGAAESPCTLRFPLWLKRGDACAQRADDVCYLSDAAELAPVLQSYAARGVREVVAVEHAAGDLVKFYGVEGTPFFYYSYPTEGGGFSKFGLESHNGAPQHFPVYSESLKEIADHAARATGFLVYGGDAIVRPDGSFLIIDFNDWPSFSVCRKAAARAIAARLKDKP